MPRLMGSQTVITVALLCALAVPAAAQKTLETVIHLPALPGTAGPSAQGEQHRADEDARCFIVYFRRNSAETTADAPEVVEQIVSLAKRLKGRVVITGHTRKSDSEKKRVALAEARASALAGAMVRLGLPLSQITATGNGSTFAIPGQDELSRKLSDRALITIYPEHIPTRVSPCGPGT